MTYQLVIWFVLVTYMPGQERKVERVGPMDARTCISMVAEHTKLAVEHITNDAKRSASCEVSKDRLL